MFFKYLRTYLRNILTEINYILNHNYEYINFDSLKHVTGRIVCLLNFLLPKFYLARSDCVFMIYTIFLCKRKTHEKLSKFEPQRIFPFSLVNWLLMSPFLTTCFSPLFKNVVESSNMRRVENITTLISRRTHCFHQNSLLPPLAIHCQQEHATGILT